MLTTFYAMDSGDGGVGNGYAGSEENKSKFPEDPGMDSGRIPDGGGPANGYINEEGHSTGEGFLGHVDDSKGAPTTYSDDEDSEAGNA